MNCYPYYLSYNQLKHINKVEFLESLQKFNFVDICTFELEEKKHCFELHGTILGVKKLLFRIYDDNSIEIYSSIFEHSYRKYNRNKTFNSIYIFSVNDYLNINVQMSYPFRYLRHEENGYYFISNKERFLKFPDSQQMKTLFNSYFKYTSENINLSVTMRKPVHRVTFSSSHLSYKSAEEFFNKFISLLPEKERFAYKNCLYLDLSMYHKFGSTAPMFNHDSLETLKSMYELEQIKKFKMKQIQTNRCFQVFN